MTLFFFSLRGQYVLGGGCGVLPGYHAYLGVFVTALLYFSAVFCDPTQMTFSIGGFNMQQIIS